MFVFYLSHGLVRVCEIELSHMGKNNGDPNLVCKNVIKVFSDIMIIFSTLKHFEKGLHMVRSILFTFNNTK